LGRIAIFYLGIHPMYMVDSSALNIDEWNVGESICMGNHTPTLKDRCFISWKINLAKFWCSNVLCADGFSGIPYLFEIEIITGFKIGQC
jgi:hypothetical protein